ncbi:MAG: hypothetical protein IJD77_00640 [Clostridia bacterium]|nr:hypothetical protein [Clostridia bacterium]
MLLKLLYIDPAATTALLSSITAIAVACGATFIILWRKLKKGVKKTLHIDENANKDVEDELVILDEDAKEAPEAEVAATEETAEETVETKED